MTAEFRRFGLRAARAMRRDAAVRAAVRAAFWSALAASAAVLALRMIGAPVAAAAVLSAWAIPPLLCAAWTWRRGPDAIRALVRYDRAFRSGELLCAAAAPLAPTALSALVEERAGELLRWARRVPPPRGAGRNGTEAALAAPALLVLAAVLAWPMPESAPARDGAGGVSRLREETAQAILEAARAAADPELRAVLVEIAGEWREARGEPAELARRHAGRLLPQFAFSDAAKAALAALAAAADPGAGAGAGLARTPRAGHRDPDTALRIVSAIFDRTGGAHGVAPAARGPDTRGGTEPAATAPSFRAGSVPVALRVAMDRRWPAEYDDVVFRYFGGTP